MRHESFYVTQGQCEVMCIIVIGTTQEMHFRLTNLDNAHGALSQIYCNPSTVYDPIKIRRGIFSAARSLFAESAHIIFSNELRKLTPRSVVFPETASALALPKKQETRIVRDTEPGNYRLDFRRVGIEDPSNAWQQPLTNEEFVGACVAALRSYFNPLLQRGLAAARIAYG